VTILKFSTVIQLYQVSILLHAIAQTSDTIGFTWADKSGQLVSRQRGILRTNCVDCLDRTNVVQSAFALAVVQKQLTKLGIISPMSNDELASVPNTIVTTLQHLWADNGDNISKQVIMMFKSLNASSNSYRNTNRLNVSYKKTFIFVQKLELFFVHCRL
jgi:hypothetical protein